MRVRWLKLRLFRFATLVAFAIFAATGDAAEAQTATQTPPDAATPSTETDEKAASDENEATQNSTDEKAAEAKPMEPLPPFAAQGPLRIPNYWDPRSRPEKPDQRIQAVRFLTSDGFPPFNFVSADGRLTGFNIEIARAVCEVLEAECTIQMRPFDEIVTALEEKRGDAIIAGLAISAKSREKLDFSDVFLRLPARFVALRDTKLKADPESLSGKWIATVAGTAHEAYLHAFFRDARIVTYPNAEIAQTALKAGEVDAFFGSGLSLGFWLAGEVAEGCCQFFGGPYTDSNYFGSGLSIAFSRENGGLKKAFDYALHRVNESGRYGELYLRYFPVSFY